MSYSAELIISCYIFYSRWPRLENLAKIETCKRSVDYKLLVNIGSACIKRLRNFLTRLSRVWFVINDNKDEAENELISEYTNDNVHLDECALDRLINTNDIIKTQSLNYHFIIDELTSLLEMSQR